MSHRRLFLTGARGFTGRHVAQLASERGYLVGESSTDLADVAELRAELCAFRPTHVLHLAGISSATVGDELAYYKVNVVGTKNLLDILASDCGPLERIIVASSAAVYGNIPGDHISESTAPFPAGPYGISKLAAEVVAASFFDKLPLSIVRPFNYTGVGHGNHFVIPKLVNAFASRSSKLEMGNLQVEREFNDVRFARDCYVQLLDTARNGQTYNLCTGRAIALTAVIAMLQEMTGHHVQIEVNPKFVRANDAARLQGDPSKLFAQIVAPATFTLKDTLQWMLDHQRNQIIPT